MSLYETDENLIDRMLTEADLCRNEGAEDIANLLDEAAKEIGVLNSEAAEKIGILTAALKGCKGLAEREAAYGSKAWAKCAAHLGSILEDK